MSSSAVRREKRSAMRERYSESVGSVGIHSGCAPLNDTNDLSIFPSLDITRRSDTFIGAPNCACYVRLRVGEQK